MTTTRRYSLLSFLSVITGLSLLFGVRFLAGDPTDPQEIRRPFKETKDTSPSTPSPIREGNSKDKPPADDRIYVWSVPHEGEQSVLILDVVGSETLDVALLHPVRVKLKTMKGQTWTTDDLRKELTGRLLQVRFHGLDDLHRPVMGLWLGKEHGWLHDLKTLPKLTVPQSQPQPATPGKSSKESKDG